MRTSIGLGIMCASDPKRTSSRSPARCSRRCARRDGTVLYWLDPGRPVFMNPHVKLATVTQSEISPAESQARVDLAATYRLIAHYGWADVIYNHSSMRGAWYRRRRCVFTIASAITITKASPKI